jgi:hypothetical protein
MTILTIESVCNAHDQALRKSLASKRGFVPCEVTINYDNASTIFAAMSTFSSLAKMKTENILIFPLSMVQLSQSEYFDIVAELVQTLRFCDHEQIIVSIDGNPNDALAEQFECENMLMTLDEIIHVRNLINSKEFNFRIFGKNPRFVHVCDDTLHTIDVHHLRS